MQQEDEENIKKKVKGWEVLQKRHDAFDALQKIGKALRDNQVQRLTFTVCSAGASTNFMDRIHGGGAGVNTDGQNDSHRVSETR